MSRSSQTAVEDIVEDLNASEELAAATRAQQPPAPSWGSMLNEAQNELILGKWWQLAAAGTAMALIVTAFSLFTDALRDALDPKLK